MTPGPHDAQDQSDVLRLAAGHDSALSDLMDRHGERLFRFLVRELQSESEAADLAEESFVRVYQHRHSFDPRHKFTTWLYAIAANLVRDRFRWRSRHPEVSVHLSEQTGADWLEQLESPAPHPGEDLDRAERAEAIRRAVAELPEELKTPLILSVYEGLAHSEIAEALGTSAKAVEMRIYRARQRLRGHLGKLLSEA